MKNEKGNSGLRVKQPETTLIPGIYNYCDRWCRFCSSQKRCALFIRYMSEKNDKENDEEFLVMGLLDVSNEEISECLDLQGVELPNFPCETKNAIPDDPDYGCLDSLISTYAEGVHRWIAESDFDTIECPFAVPGMHILYYDSRLIHSRIGMLLAGHSIHCDNKDYRCGMAKVSMLSVERSQKLWDLIFDLLPGQVEPGQPLKATLGEIRELMEKFFPDAMSFIRPGLDGQV